MVSSKLDIFLASGDLLPHLHHHHHRQNAVWSIEQLLPTTHSYTTKTKGIFFWIATSLHHIVWSITTPWLLAAPFLSLTFPSSLWSIITVSYPELHGFCLHLPQIIGNNLTHSITHSPPSLPRSLALHQHQLQPRLLVVLRTLHLPALPRCNDAHALNYSTRPPCVLPIRHFSRIVLVTKTFKWNFSDATRMRLPVLLVWLDAIVACIPTTMAAAAATMNWVTPTFNDSWWGTTMLACGKTLVCVLIHHACVCTLCTHVCATSSELRWNAMITYLPTLLYLHKETRSKWSCLGVHVCFSWVKMIPSPFGQGEVINQPLHDGTIHGLWIALFFLFRASKTDVVVVVGKGHNNTML